MEARALAAVAPPQPARPAAKPEMLQMDVLTEIEMLNNAGMEIREYQERNWGSREGVVCL